MGEENQPFPGTSPLTSYSLKDGTNQRKLGCQFKREMEETWERRYAVGRSGWEEMIGYILI